MRVNVLLLGTLAALATAPPARAGDDPLFLWRAERDGARIWLLGSVHVGSDDFFPLDNRIESALAAADTVACEINMTDPIKAGQAALLSMQKGTYPAGETLRDHVSDDTWRAVAAAVDTLQVPVSLVERMRPALAAVTIMALQLQQQGLDPDQGIDRHVLEQAHAQHKPIVDLETVAQQIDLLLGQDAAVGELLLEESLEQQETPAVIDSMLTAWRQGDPAAIARLVNDQWLDDPRLVDYHERVIDRRNEAMTAMLDRRAGAARNSWFVVVGAGHLVGERGIPKLLAARGWRVVQVR